MTVRKHTTIDLDMELVSALPAEEVEGFVRADVVDADSLQKVRDHKKQMKAAAKAAR